MTQQEHSKKRRRRADGRMPLQAHLVELKNRIIVSAIAVLLCSVAGWFLYEPVLAELIRPLTDLSDGDTGRVIMLNFSTVTAAFDFHVRIAFYIGVVLASPVWIFQILAFIAPGLTKSERKYTYGFMIAAIPMFLAGGYSGYYLIPRFVAFMLDFTPEGVANIPEVQVYLQMVTQIILALGLSFLTPVMLVAANFMGLMSGRTMLSGWRWMVVAAFTFAAIVTPTPEVTLMFFVASPLLVLFALAVLVSFARDAVTKRKLDKELGSLDE